MMLKIILSICIPFILFSNQQQHIKFPSKDGINISADLYLLNENKAPFIILFHQAGWSSGEYKEIAPKLNDLGYNCIAINQRSGGEVNDVLNQTYELAKEKGKSTTYIDAYVDMQAALDYVVKTYKPHQLIIWGSSYSAALSLKLVSDNPEKVGAVLAFSPGEYFSKLGKSETFITDNVKNLKCPVFITSAKNEKSYWEKIYKAIPSKNKSFFLPETDGNHGSRALWEKFDNNKDYWKAVKKFLQKHFSNE